MPDDSAVTLPIHCVKCGQAVTLSYTRDESYTMQHWKCPYHECRASNQVIIGGTGLSAVARYEPPGALGGYARNAN